MRLLPPEFLTTWPTPNYINPDTRGPALTIISTVLLALSIFVVGLRLYTKLHIVKSFDIDDALILAAVFPSIAFLVCIAVVENDYDWNRHSWDIQLSQVLKGRKFILATQLLWGVATFLVRLSILFFVRRLFLNSGTRLSIAIGVSIWASILMFLGYFFMFLFQCRYVVFMTLSIILKSPIAISLRLQ
jgi:hypothetical protein